ncbi:MAG: Gfo/Idh/MocA family oxidoreductase [Bacteroidales bacterium]|jgi:predicted dehydrogenase|nr:Gfo/Idh/MocA family oxidoreductase [Bacteroidales bacterium]
MINRRNFIRSSSAIAAGMAMSLPGGAASRKTAPSDRLHAALIGCRNMGWGNLRDLLQHGGVKCLALCDIDQKILHSRAEEIDRDYGYRPDTYGDYRKIIDRKDIDIVVIGTPDHWHCLPFVDACRAGKDIYVEKPIANSIAECDVMVAAAGKYNRIVQVGQQQRSSRHFADMVEYLRSGKLGSIGRVHVWANFNYAAMSPLVPDSPVPEGVDFDMWLGPAPQTSFNSNRFHGSWRMFWDYGGGLLTDWGVHLIDMGLWGMDVKTMPLKVAATGGKYLYPDGAHQTFDSLSVTYQFKDFILEWENNAGVETGPYGKNYGILFLGTNGTLVANRDDWSVYPEKGKLPEITVKADHRERQTHIANFLECVKTRNPHTACTIENGSLCAKYAQLGNIAAKVGETLVYDDKAGKFNRREADKYLKPTYRSPWKFPQV